MKHPDEATHAAQKAAQNAKKEQADRTKTWRRVGIGAGAIAGGVLIGVTGGLAAPLVGAGLSSVLGILGIGGPVGLLATGLASSGAVCGALFGVYGAKSTAQMVARHTREIQDFAFVPVHPPRDSLAVRLCISGWLTSPHDVTAPWTVFDSGEDTFALQWVSQFDVFVLSGIQVACRRSKLSRTFRQHYTILSNSTPSTT